ncbi:MAG: prepilin-type N-terminal cleavage/methylation domain-containing protein [Lachnospiraceae bacterium]|nr:prepilin-type N-terminal cleavage/methylation domain-containing protein [Lachnospiraceae bacterium]
MKKTNNKGLSVVELVIVIAIMSIVVTVIAVSITKFIQRSRLSADVSNANVIATAINTAMNEADIKVDIAPQMVSGGTGMIMYATPGQPFQVVPMGTPVSSLFLSTVNQNLGGKSPELKYLKNGAACWFVTITPDGKIIIQPGDSSPAPMTDKMFPNPSGVYTGY